MFFLLAFYSSSKIIGVDLGSDYIRATCLKVGKQVEILFDTDNSREFSTILTMVPIHSKNKPLINLNHISNYRFVFNDINLMKKFPNNTIRFWTSFLGKQPTRDLIDIAKRRRLWGTPSLFMNDKLFICGILPETVFCLVMDRINNSAHWNNDGSKFDSLIISVPKFFPQTERDLLHSVSKKIGYNAFIVDNTRAISTNFAFDNKRIFAKRPYVVAFIDFGSSNFQVAISRFSKDKKIKIEEIFYDYDDSIGGRDIDIAIVEILKNKLTINYTSRVEQAIIAESTRIKHRLSINSFASGSIDGIDDVNGFSYNITRGEFEKAIDDIVQRIKQILGPICRNIQIDRIQMLGGSSRVPIIQETIVTMFKTKKVMVSMNPEDTNAIAASYFGASISSDFLLPDIEYKSIDLYQYSIRNIDQIFDFRSYFPHFNDDFWILQIGDKFPIGSTPFIGSFYVTDGSSMKFTKDGLLRFNLTNGKKPKPWKYQALSNYAAIQEEIHKAMNLEDLTNSFEAFIFDLKELLQKEVILNLSIPSQLETLTQTIMKLDKWYIDQSNFEIESLEKKFSFLLDQSYPLILQYQNHLYLQKSLDNITSVIRSIEHSISDSKKYSRTQIRRIIRVIVNAKIWLDEKLSIQKTLIISHTPILSWLEIHKKAEHIFDEFNVISKELLNQKHKEKARSFEEKNVYIYPPNSINLNMN